MRIGTGLLACASSISDNGNKISYGVVYGHIDGGFSVLPGGFDYTWYLSLQGKLPKGYSGQSKFPNGCPGPTGKGATVDKSNGRRVAREF